MQPHPVQSTNAKGQQRPFVLQPPELALDGSAGVVELARPLQQVEDALARQSRRPARSRSLPRYRTGRTHAHTPRPHEPLGGRPRCADGCCPTSLDPPRRGWRDDWRNAPPFGPGPARASFPPRGAPKRPDCGCNGRRETARPASNGRSPACVARRQPYLCLAGMGSFLARYDALEGRGFDQRVVAARAVDRCGERDGGATTASWADPPVARPTPLVATNARARPALGVRAWQVSA